MSNFITEYNDIYYYGNSDSKNARVFFTALSNNGIEYFMYGSIPSGSDSQDVSDTSAMMRLEIFAAEYVKHDDWTDTVDYDNDDRTGDAPTSASVETVSDALVNVYNTIDSKTGEINDKVTSQADEIKTLKEQVASLMSRIAVLEAFMTGSKAKDISVVGSTNINTEYAYQYSISTVPENAVTDIIWSVVKKESKAESMIITGPTGIEGTSTVKYSVSTDPVNADIDITWDVTKN